MKALEEGQTSRVVFGGLERSKELDTKGWKVYNPIEFLSPRYFDKYN